MMELIPLTFDDLTIMYIITPILGCSFVIFVKLFAHFIKI